MLSLRRSGAMALIALVLAAACGGESRLSPGRPDAGTEPSEAGSPLPEAGTGMTDAEAGADPRDPTGTSCVGSNGFEVAIRRQDLCDGRALCTDGRDERDDVCPFGLGYHCRGTDVRIERRRVCDGVVDCPDDDDEPCFRTARACPEKAPVVAAWLGGASVCAVKGIGDADLDFTYVHLCDSGDRIQPSQVCNAIVDCPDGDDEDGCPNICRPTCDDTGCTYPPCEMPCADGSTVLISDVCDGVSDCPGGEDEACIDRFGCPNDDPAQGIDFSQVCDGIADCSDGYDERTCPRAAEGAYFVCDDGEQILFPYFSAGCYGLHSPHEPFCSDGSAPYFPCGPIR